VTVWDHRSGIIFVRYSRDFVITKFDCFTIFFCSEKEEENRMKCSLLNALIAVYDNYVRKGCEEIKRERERDATL
jgi:hypothetical protein